MIFNFFKNTVILLILTGFLGYYLSLSTLLWGQVSSDIREVSAQVTISQQNNPIEITQNTINPEPLEISVSSDNKPVITLAKNNPQSYDWSEIDQQLSKNLRVARSNTEELAQFELNAWKRELMKKVDDEFLDWYYGYFHQKGMEFGVPFAWLAFKLDQRFNNLSKENEKDLNPSEIIQERMVEDFNRKFQELVVSRDAEELLKEKIERIGITYATSIGTQFSKVKAQYQVSDPEWEEHLGNLAQLIYNTGNSESDLSAIGLNSNLSTKVFAATTVTVGTKLAAKFAGNAVGKTATKAGASVAAKAGAQLLDPILAVGFLVWDVWDYQNMVDQSRPELRQNISDYLEELKYSILSGEDSILSAISEVEADLYRELQNLSSNYS